MNYPKILIIGQSFNKKNGGGVTISNLFKDWPKDRLAVASNNNLYSDLDTSVCNTYYQLGYGSKLHPFPLNIILPKINCGIIPASNNAGSQTQTTPVKAGKYKVIYQAITATLHFLGLYNFFYKLKITPEFAAWVKAYKPDVIYAQLATLEMITFVDEVHELIKKPVALHIMDDWPLTISKPGILYSYWKKRIDKAFRALINKSAVLMSICDAMSDEYKVRYGKDFVPFHNPIDIDYWKPAAAKDYSVKNKFIILYAGRIGFGIQSSVAAIADAVNEIAKTNKNIIFEIQTGDAEALKKSVQLSEQVKWNAPIPYAGLPAKFAGVSLLLLPQDFDAKSVQFLKYSFPTKVSEYMISGTPILVYGDKCTGLTRHALKNEWCYVVTENNATALIKAINDLYNNAALRKKLGENAQQIAEKTEDAKTVRENFRKALSISNFAPVS
jgi:glycosyltransferase involved in cell wall biosynthesis